MSLDWIGSSSAECWPILFCVGVVDALPTISVPILLLSTIYNYVNDYTICKITFVLFQRCFRLPWVVINKWLLTRLHPIGYQLLRWPQGAFFAASVANSSGGALVSISCLLRSSDVVVRWSIGPVAARLAIHVTIWKCQCHWCLCHRSMPHCSCFGAKELLSV